MNPPLDPTKSVAVIREVAGEPTTFEVRSFTDPLVWYRVELQAHDNAGQCGCIRWDTTCWPIIRDTHNLPPSKRCRHLKAAREYYCQKKLREERRYE